MKLYNWKRMPEEPMNPLLGRKVVHGQFITIARVSLRRSAVVPRHSHANEQITMLQEGSLRFVFDDGEVVLQAGELLEIPPHAPHLVEALEDSVAVDLFSPIREDWLRGDDAYLRSPVPEP